MFVQHLKAVSTFNSSCKHNYCFVCLRDVNSSLYLRPFSRQTRRSLCEEALLKIRGVISFTFQMAVKRCVVRIRSDLKAEVFSLKWITTQVYPRFMWGEKNCFSA